MPRPLGHIRLLFSARVLFDLEEADKIFAEKGEKEYADYMRARGNYAKDFDPEVMGRRLNPGPLWNLAVAALRLNEKSPDTVEVGVVCKDTSETAFPIFRNLDLSGLTFQYRIAKSGKGLETSDLESFGADAFFTRNAKDAQLAVDYGVAAAAINFPEGATYTRKEGAPVRLWLDGDAVTFGSSAELGYRTDGLEQYRINEFNRVAQPIEEGPFTKLLVKISDLNKKFPKGEQPFELSLLTARGDVASARVMTTLENLGIEFNGDLYFVSGASKNDVLKAKLPDLFLDDQQVHLEKPALYCPTGHVPYKTGSDIFEYLKAQAAKVKDADKKDPPTGPTGRK